MIVVQTGNMIDVVVEGTSLGLKPRGGDDILWLPEPEGLRDVLAAEINRIKPTAAHTDHATPEIGAELICLVCAYRKPWAIFDNKTGAAVCFDCRDAVQR